MNISQIKNIIKIYKEQFQFVHSKEIYKWRATKQFQDNWNPNATDYRSMLEDALKYSKNLLDSSSYYPKRMISNYLEKDTNSVKFLFNELFNEEKDLFERMDAFQNGIHIIHNKYFKTLKNTFQDHRAIIFYLCMRYPERYYLYKFEMVKKFYKLIDYPDKPKAGKKQNILHYYSVCEIINQEILKNDDLIKLHYSRLTKEHYQDQSLHILTQDIIFAATHFLGKYLVDTPLIPIAIKEGELNLEPDTFVINLSGGFSNYIENEKENKKIGDIGELIILEYERSNTKKLNIPNKPTHDAKDIGDGIGYDILSFDKAQTKKYIEVKTTRGKKTTPFFITQNELIKSQLEKENYYLYRLYELDEKEMNAKLYIIKGDLTKYCMNPVKYKVALKKIVG